MRYSLKTHSARQVLKPSAWKWLPSHALQKSDMIDNGRRFATSGGLPGFGIDVCRISRIKHGTARFARQLRVSS